jgi:hypothetical protein
MDTIKNKSRLLLAVIIVVIYAGCSKTISQAHPESSKPIICDLGDVFLTQQDRSSWVAQHDFSFQNPSSLSIAELSVAEKTCGCTRCVIEKPHMQPGETTIIRLSYDLPYMRKSAREGVVITTGLIEFPKMEYVLTADVYPRLTMIPYNPPPINVLAGTSKQVQVTFIAYQPENEKNELLKVFPVGKWISVETVQRELDEVRNGVRKSSANCTLRVNCPGVDDENIGIGEFSSQIEVYYGVHMADGNAGSSVSRTGFLAGGTEPIGGGRNSPNSQRTFHYKQN